MCESDLRADCVVKHLSLKECDRARDNAVASSVYSCDSPHVVLRNLFASARVEQSWKSPPKDWWTFLGFLHTKGGISVRGVRDKLSVEVRGLEQ